MTNTSFTIEGITIAHRFKAPKGWYSAEYAAERPRHGLIYVLEGSARYEMSSGESFTAEKDDILCMPKGCSYLTHAGDSFLHLTINFDMQGVLELPLRRHCADGEKTRRDMHRIISEWSERAPNYREKSLGRLYLLLCEQIDICHRDRGETREKLQNAIALLESDCSDEISVARLAESCAMSETYFRKLFANAFGMSPMAYMTHKRMSYACELLQNTGLSIEEVCYESGYKDPSYFCRMFKKFTGMPPSEYRAAGGA